MKIIKPLLYTTALAGWVLFLASQMPAQAHPPCQNTCQWVQVINPVTGELTQQYVCS